MRKCPFCAEDIQEEAIKCRWCGEFLDANAKPKPKWYTSGPALFVAFLVVGPFILPVVWSKRAYSTPKKVIITIVVLLATLALVKASASIVEKIMMAPVNELMYK